MNLPDAWLVSGCLFQTVWNVLAGHPPQRAIKDYDIFYFDAENSSSSDEDCINRRAAKLYSDIDCAVDIRNQARVHTWYESEFGVSGYPQLQCSTDGIDNFLAVCCMVGVSKSASEEIVLYAPFGVEDVMSCIMRRNPWFSIAPRDCYETKATRWSAHWPNLRVMPFDAC